MRQVAILFGGQSPEHEVSLQSAYSVLQAIDRDRFDVISVGITKQGRWLKGDGVLGSLSVEAASGDGPMAEVARDVARETTSHGEIQEVVLDVGRAAFRLVDSQPQEAEKTVDVEAVFPVLHGPGGEDGTVQGMLELARIPYVGPGVLGSSLAMDKVRAKCVLEGYDLPVVRSVAIPETLNIDEGVERVACSPLQFPVFVKPARAGSSVGVSKCVDRQELWKGMEAARAFDELLLVEEAVDGAREIECSVLGNLEPQASVPGEVVPSKEFYDYEDKYVLGEAELRIPAPLAPEQLQRVKELAVRAVRALHCEGMARVDCLMDPTTSALFINEVNTIPGFTPISMYPKLWEHTGMAYSELITRLFELAVDRSERLARFR